MPKPREKFQHEHEREPITPLTFNQELYFSAIYQYPDEVNGDDAFVIAKGRAGTGKTFVASTLAADLYLSRVYRQIVIVKPMVGPEEMGFLPGNEDEKFAPWIATVTEPLKQRLGKGKFECDFGKTIFAAPLEYIRGKTFDNAFIIIDEAQNLTVSQMKVILTRIGKHSKMVFCGDDKQIDLPADVESGLEWLVRQIKRRQETGIEIIEFTRADNVRSAACKKALDIIED